VQAQRIIEGTVSYFNPAERRITVLQFERQRKGLFRLEVPLKFDPHVLISTMDQGILKLTGLKAGKKVRIRYVTRTGDKRIAKIIHVLKG